MSSATSAANAGNAAAVKEESPEPVGKGVWRVELTDDSQDDISHSIVPLWGKCPDDNAYRSGQLNYDARGLGALSVRFTSDKRASLLMRSDWQDETRDFIWTKIKQLRPDAKLSSELPAATFGELPEVNGRRRATIDLVFTSVNALRMIKHLDEIHLEGVHGETHVYSREAKTEELPGNIIAVDCVGLAIDNLDHPGVFAAFQTMAQAIGKVIGMAKIVVASEEWGTSHNSGEVRAYVEIHPNNMLAPWNELMLKFSTHLRLNGVPYPLLFPSRHLHGKDVFSANFNIGPPGEGSSASATSSTKRSHAAEDDADAASAGAKKPRCSEEE